MTHLFAKVSALTLCLLSALPVPALATPNESQEQRLEVQEELQQLSESLKPEPRTILNHGWSGYDSFYGDSYGGSIFFRIGLGGLYLDGKGGVALDGVYIDLGNRHHHGRPYRPYRGGYRRPIEHHHYHHYYNQRGLGYDDSHLWAPRDYHYHY